MTVPRGGGPYSAHEGAAGAQELLFDIEPLWCLDTNVVVSFLREDDEEAYSRQVLPQAWQAFEADIATGLIVAPTQVRDELEVWCADIPDMHLWLASRPGMFRELDAGALGWAKTVVNAYPAYASSRTTRATCASSRWRPPWGSRLSPTRSRPRVSPAGRGPRSRTCAPS